MPNIREYTSPEAESTPLRPDFEGSAAFAQAGRRIGIASREEGAAYARVARAAGTNLDEQEKHAARDEILKGLAMGAELNNQITQKYNATIKDPSFNPNNTHFGQDFNDQIVKPAMDHYVAQFTTDQGKEFATRFAASHTQHWFEKTAADMSNLSAIGAQQNLTVMANSYSSSVRTDPTPESADLALGTVDAAVDALVTHSPNLTAEQAAKIRGDLSQRIKGQIVKSMFSGMADANPDEALTVLNSGKYSEYINGADMSRDINTIKRLKKADEIEAQRQAKQQAAQLSADTMGTYTQALFDKQGNFAPPPNFLNQLARDPRIQKGDKGSLFTMYNRLKKEGDQESNGNVLHQFVGELSKGVSDPSDFQRRVLDHVGKDLSKTDASWLMTQLKDPAAREDLSEFKSTLSKAERVFGGGPFGAIMGRGASQALALHSWAYQQLKRAQASGIPIRELSDPSSKAFLFTPENLNHFIDLKTGVHVIPESGGQDFMKKPTLELPQDVQ